MGLYTDKKECGCIDSICTLDFPPSSNTAIYCNEHKPQGWGVQPKCGCVIKAEMKNGMPHIYIDRFCNEHDPLQKTCGCVVTKDEEEGYNPVYVTEKRCEEHEKNPEQSVITRLIREFVMYDKN